MRMVRSLLVICGCRRIGLMPCVVVPTVSMSDHGILRIVGVRLGQTATNHRAP